MTTALIVCASVGALLGMVYLVGVARILRRQTMFEKELLAQYLSPDQVASRRAEVAAVGIATAVDGIRMRNELEAERDAILASDTSQSCTERLAHITTQLTAIAAAMNYLGELNQADRDYKMMAATQKQDRQRKLRFALTWPRRVFFAPRGHRNWKWHDPLYSLIDALAGIGAERRMQRRREQIESLIRQQESLVHLHAASAGAAHVQAAISASIREIDAEIAHDRPYKDGLPVPREIRDLGSHIESR